MRQDGAKKKMSKKPTAQAIYSRRYSFKSSSHVNRRNISMVTLSEKNEKKSPVIV
jgi:hypothetical protein